MTAYVLLDSGRWLPRDKLEPGLLLASPDGRGSEVLEVGPRLLVPAKKVIFRDQREVVVDASQSWKILCDRWAAGSKILSTTELVEASETKRNWRRLGTPIVTGDFGSGDLPLDPWLLGVLLGDGCLRGAGPTITTADDEIRTAVAKAVTRYGAILTKRNELTWGIAAGYGANRVTRILIQLNLWGRLSTEKHIPCEFLEAGLADRVALFQGLMDTDGTAGKDGSVQYCSSSDELSRQVQTLVHSIGGVCSRRRKKTTHADTYILGVRLREPKEAFRLQRKRLRLSQPNKNGSGLAPRINEITDASPFITRRFRCDEPEGLFVGESYIVMRDDRGTSAPSSL